MKFNIPDKSFYFVRHGFTDANRDELWSGGGWDISLNEIGIAQAQKASLLVLSLEHEIDKIFCSPMIRSKQTTDLLNSKTLKPVEIIENLREWKVGELEGKPWDKSILKTPIEKWGHPPGGESIFDFYQRVGGAVEFCLNEAKTPLISAHGAVGRALLKLLNLPDQHIENCQIYKIQPILTSKLSWTIDSLK
ncbi:MAG: histidine phosphatase family protein [Pseudobdellovibrio sp.]